LLIIIIRRRFTLKLTGPKQRTNSKLKGKISSNSNQKTGRTDWIEKLLRTPIEDRRNYCLWAILVPYLLNVKHLSEEDTFNILKEWLEKCDELKRLSFAPEPKIYSTIKGNKGYKPISFSKLKEENNNLFNILTPQ
jgi:hypothetical protein